VEIHEVPLDDSALETLIALSRDWAAENSCWGYHANTRAYIEGNRVFLAEEGGAVLGYLFGRVCRSENMRSIMPEGTPFFEVEELYVVPARRGEGIGAALFRYVEEVVRGEAEYVVLSTATKSWRSILHFYLDELDMRFWSARLFKPLR